jgi:amino acid transporter
MDITNLDVGEEVSDCKQKAAVQMDLSQDQLDEKHLVSLGYKQELYRNVTFWGSVGITLGCMQPLLSAGTLFYALGWGGPREVVWSFVGCFVWSFFIALSMAEISSQYTVAGGPYYWAGALAGRFGRFPSYVLGWVLFLGLISGVVSYENQVAQQIISIKLILDNSRLGTPPGALGDVSGIEFGVPLPNQPSLPFQKAFYGITAGCCVIHSLANFIPVKGINYIAIASFLWLLGVSALMMFVLPGITPERESGSFVFTKWVPSVSTENSESLWATGLPNDSWTACVGFTMAQYLLLVYDTPAHMSEETKSAGSTVPKAILFSYVVGGLLNFGMLVSYLFCMNLSNYQVDPMAPDDVVALGNFLTGGVTNGLFPVGNIYYDAFMQNFGRAEGAAVFTAFICVGTNFCCILTITTAVRFMYSFARDGGFPFSNLLAYVEPRTGVPVNCVVVFCICVMLFQTGIFAENWYSTINGIGSVVANGFLFVYGVPSLLRVVNRKAFKPAKEFSLGWASIPCAIIGSAYCLFSVITICIPNWLPVTATTLNVAPVFLGVVLTWACLSFPVVAYFNFYKGPALSSDSAAVNVQGETQA